MSLFSISLIALICCELFSASKRNIFDENYRSVQKLNTATPIVMWHGMGDTCCNPLTLGRFKYFLERYLPGGYVLSLKIGNDIVQDFKNSYLMNVNKQIEMACSKIRNDPKLENGYNAIGFSQGSQFLRAVAQRCPNPPMKTLVSIGGQHQGVYGFPKCPGVDFTVCDYVRKLLNLGAYISFVQKTVVQAQYWHDPLKEDEYKAKSVFLADINNEIVKNSTYKENLKKLENFVMVKFTEDSTVSPRESQFFGFYKGGQGKEIETLQESLLYKEDWLGLREMDEAGKLHFIEHPGDHMEAGLTWLKDNIVDRFLK